MAMKRMFWVGAAVRVEVRRRRAVRRWLIGDCGLRIAEWGTTNGTDGTNGKGRLNVES